MLTQIAARFPDEPLAPRTANTATSVTITWEEPFNGATSIVAYRVEIGTNVLNGFDLEKTYCNAEYDATIIESRSCSIPMSIFTESPFNLAQGDEIVARVYAINAIGESDVSELSSTHSTTGALVQQRPLKPATLPSRGSETTIT